MNHRFALVFLFASSLFSAPLLHAAAPSALPVPDVFVDDDYDANTPGWGVTHFATIQDGLANVDPGGTVHIQSGSYVGAYALTQAVTLQGEGPTKPLLTGTASPIVSVEVAGCTLRGLDFDSPGFQGVELNAGNVLIEGCRFANLTRGIRGWDVTGGVTIEGNEFTACTRYPVQALRVDSLILRDNQFSNCSEEVYAQSCDDAIIERNAVSGLPLTGLNLRGDRLVVRQNVVDHCGTGMRISTTGGLVESNRVDSCGFGFLHQGRGGSVRSNGLTEIEFVGIIFRNDTDAFDNRLRNVSSFPSSRGMSVDFPLASQTIMRHNLVIGFGVAFEMPPINDSDIQGVEFTENVIIGSLTAGFRHWGSSFQSPILTRNAILSGQTGLVSETLGSSALAVENSFIDNQIGIQIDPLSSGWRFHRSNFRNAVNAQVDGSAELFSLVPPFGNFWSDYGGTDGNGDGFGDTPYLAPGTAGATDQFPYIEPTGRSMLWSDSYSTPAAGPTPLTLHLEAGSTFAGKSFILLPSITGLTPGLPLPSGQTLPIAVDPLTNYLLVNLSSPAFSGFSGTLDAQGAASTTITLPPLPASFAGRFVFLAAIIGPPFVQPSNALAIFFE